MPFSLYSLLIFFVIVICHLTILFCSSKPSARDSQSLLSSNPVIIADGFNIHSVLSTLWLLISLPSSLLRPFLLYLSYFFPWAHSGTFNHQNHWFFQINDWALSLPSLIFLAWFFNYFHLDNFLISLDPLMRDKSPYLYHPLIFKFFSLFGLSPMLYNFKNNFFNLISSIWQKPLQC